MQLDAGVQDAPLHVATGGLRATFRRPRDSRRTRGVACRSMDADVTLTIEPGDAVTVVRASMGTFRITDKRGRSARFKRMK